MNKIFYVKQHSVFSTDGNTGRLWREEKHMHWLAKAGYKVLWISSNFDHYSKVKRHVIPEIEGVEIRQFVVPSYKKNVSLSRLIGNWFFAIRLFIFLMLNRKMIGKLICAYPTPESSLICVLVSKITGIPLIIDMRDNWPEALVYGSNLSIVARLFKSYCNMLNKIIFVLHNQFIGMSDGVLKKIKPNIRNKPKSLCLALPNTITTDSLISEIPVSLAPDKIYISFFGTLNSQFKFDIFDNNLSEIETRFPNVTFLVVGNGERYKEYKQSFSEKKNIQFLGRIKYGEVLSIASQSRAFFCFYHNPETFKSHFTNKIIEYMQFGKPFIHNLDCDFYLNDIKYRVGCSMLDISLIDFIEKLIEGNGRDDFIDKNTSALKEFNESTVKMKFLKVIAE